MNPPVAEQPRTSAFLPRADLGRLLDALAAGGHRVIGHGRGRGLLSGLAAGGRRMIGPTVRDGAVVYEEIRDVQDLPIGRSAESAPGSYRLRPTGRDRVFDYGVAVTA